MSLSFRTNGNFIDFVNTDATSLERETVLMSLHNTSRAVSWSLPTDTTKINFTIDEIKYSNIPISEIDFDGTVMNSQDDFETGITGMFAGLAGGGSGGGVESVMAGDASIEIGGSATEPTVKLPYLVYTALLSQSGTDAPVPTMLQNTLGGDPVFAFGDTGYFTATLNGVFTIGKTFVTIGSGQGNLGRKFLAYGNFSADYIELESGTFDGNPINGVMNNCPLEIRVYP